MSGKTVGMRIAIGAFIGAVVGLLAALVLRGVADGVSDGDGRLITFAVLAAVIGGLGALLITAERRDDKATGRRRDL